MLILWFPLTILCALALATSDALTKKALASHHNEYMVAWWIVYGHMLFQETGLRKRLSGGVLMVAGVVLIVLGES